MSELWVAATVAVVAYGASSALASKPKVPGLAPINPDASGRDAANLNLAALPDAKKLGQEVNAYNQGELDKSFEDIFPGYKDAARNAGSNISDMVAGKISDQTAAEVARRSAVRAVGSTGTFGPRGQSLEARDLGITSESLKQSGLTALSGWLASAKGSLIAPKFDVTSMFLTPEQLFQNRTAERSAQFQRQNAANQIDAYYSASSRAGRAFESIGGAAAGYLSAGGGGGGGRKASAPGSGGWKAQTPGQVDEMMNGPVSYGGSGFYSPTSYGQQVNFGLGSDGSKNPYATPYWGGA